MEEQKLNFLTDLFQNVCDTENGIQKDRAIDMMANLMTSEISEAYSQRDEEIHENK